MYETVNEQIEILANFTQKGPIPIVFTWRQKEYYIDAINFVHASKEGDAKLIHFSVSNDRENYKLTFDTKSLTWTLNEIYTNSIPLQNNVTLKERSFVSYMYAQRLK